MRFTTASFSSYKNMQRINFSRYFCLFIFNKSSSPNVVCYLRLYFWFKSSSITGVTITNNTASSSLSESLTKLLAVVNYLANFIIFLLRKYESCYLIMASHQLK